MGQKKCPHCGQWSPWTMDRNDACEHCGKPLAVEELIRHKNRQDEIKRNEDNWIFNIKPSDSSFTKGAKKVGNFFYTIFMAIISFILWLIAVLPG